MEPWICPRCGTVWNGWVMKCTCRPPTVTTTTSSQGFPFPVVVATRCPVCGRELELGEIHLHAQGQSRTAQ